MKKSSLLGSVCAFSFLFFNPEINAALLGGSVSGCIGVAPDACVTQPGTGWFSGLPKTIVDPGVEFSHIQDVNVRGFVGFYADFTDTELILIIDGTDAIDNTPSVGRASLNWVFSDIVLIPPNRVITELVPVSQSGLNFTTYSFDSDYIFINTSGFSYSHLAGKVLSATFKIETREVNTEQSIEISGGEIQECVTEGGNLVTFSYVRNVDVASIEWLLDGVSVGFEVAVNTFVTLGEHAIDANVTTAQGDNLIESATVKIVDSTAPIINATFINPESGNLIISVEHKADVEAAIEVSDTCDPAPTSNAIAGVSAQSQDVMGIKGKKQDANITSITLTSPPNSDSVELSINARDASGNISIENVVLPVVP